MPQAGPQIIRITNADDPRLADYANIRDRQLAAMNRLASDASHGGLFMAEGELVVRQLLRSPYAMKSVLITQTRLESMRDALVALPAQVPILLVDQALMTGVVGFHIHRGILAAGIRPPPLDPAIVIARARTLVILEDLANHDNVGGVFRAAAALGGLEHTGILLSPRCCDPLYRKAIRVSMGTALRIPFATLAQWPEALDEVRRAGFTLIALTPQASNTDVVRPDRPALLFGAEGPGLTGAAMDRASVRVRIPISREVDSLNVVVAAGIALHEFRARG